MRSTTEERDEVVGPSRPTAGEPPRPRLGRRVAPRAALRLARLTLASQGGRMLLVALGTVVAVVLICTVPLYSTLVANIQLQAAINGAGPVGRNVEAVVGTSDISAQAQQEGDGIIRPLGAQYLAPITQPQVSNFLIADTVSLGTVNGRQVNLPGGDRFEATLEAFDYAQIGPHMRLLAGALPQASPGDSSPLEALITAQMAQMLHVQVGDAVTMTTLNGSTVRTRVVGIWEPRNPDENFWNGRSFLAVPIAAGLEQAYVFPILLDRGAFLTGLENVPQLGMEQHWIYYTVPTRITTANMADVAARLAQLHTAIAVAREQLIGLYGNGQAKSDVGAITLTTDLDTVIPALQRQLGLVTLPLYGVVGQVAALVLLALGTVGSMLVESQAGEIATLRSRGASRAQVLGGYTLLAAALGGLTALAGPWLAQALALRLTDAFVPASTRAAAQVSEGYLAGLAAPRVALVPAVAGALAAVGVVVVAAFQATRLDVLAYRRAEGRLTRPPWWRRYYLDLWLVGICMLAYVELGQLGGLEARAALGPATNSPLLLVAPSLLLLAGGLLILRLFPLAVAAGLRLAARGRGATTMLALTQLTRSASGPGRLTLLLALAVGVGVSALVFDATLARNATDRAAYQAGADLRLVETGTLQDSFDLHTRHELAGLPGVQGVTPVYRGFASVPAQASFQQTELLAVDPDSWGRVGGATFWRSEYASVPLTTLMAQMRAHQWTSAPYEPVGITVGDSAHPIWAIVSRSFATALGLRVGDDLALGLPNAAQETTQFKVGAIVEDFPTSYATRSPGGAVVIDFDDFTSVRASPALGPDEYWLKVTGDAAQRAALSRALELVGPSLIVNQIIDRRMLQTQIEGNPLQAGMRGLLLAGALAAIALAVLASLTQAALTVRQRTVHLAVLRTLGMRSRHVLGMLLWEQAIVHASALVGGTAVGLVLALATVPFLQFSDTSLDPVMLGVPPYALVAHPAAVALFYLGVAASLGVAMALTARYAARIGLGQALRIGED